jgi:hypothetical protein
MPTIKYIAVWAGIGISIAQACMREREFATESSPIVRRQDPVTFPPVLNDNEAILSNSFDNTSIDTWSYYYTHGLHVAGTNRSMAQWTADRWNEFGFKASLAEYCMKSHSWGGPDSLSDLTRRLPQLPSLALTLHVAIERNQLHSVFDGSCLDPG